MTIKTTSVVVGATPTALAGPFTGTGLQPVMVVNGSSVPVFIGGPDVATSGPTQGVQLAAGQSLSADLVGGASTGDGLYGIVASGTAAVTVMRGGA